MTLRSIRSLIHRPARHALEHVAHRAHRQPVDYNALHGGMERWFEPIEPPVVDSLAWLRFSPGTGARARDTLVLTYREHGFQSPPR